MAQQDSNIPEFIRQISVVGVAEVSSPPDIYSFEVVIRSSNYSLDDVKDSVTTQLSYIEEAMKDMKQQRKPEVLKTFSEEEKRNTLVADVTLAFCNMETCNDMRNLLIEKLDSNAVDVGPVQFDYTKMRMDDLRIDASSLALENAKNKASRMVENLPYQYLGPPMMIREEKSQEWFGLLPNSSSSSEKGEINFFRQTQIKMATKSVKSEVHAQFELKGLEGRR